MRDGVKRPVPPTFGSDDELAPRGQRPRPASLPPAKSANKAENTSTFSFRSIGRSAAGGLSPRFMAPINVEEDTENPKVQSQKPNYLNMGSFPFRLDRDEREKEVKRFMAAVGYIGEYKISTGRDPMDISVRIYFGSFEIAREFRLSFREHPALKYEENGNVHQLYLNTPTFGRDRVLSIYSKRAHDLLAGDLAKYGIDTRSTTAFSRASGGLFVGRLKVGYVSVGMVRDAKGFPVSFVFTRECPEALKKDVFMKDVTAMIA